MIRSSTVLSRIKATARIALAILFSAVAFGAATPSVAQAAWWEPSTPWNGHIYIYCFEDYVYQSDSLTFTMDIWDVGPSTKGLRIDIALTDSTGASLRWDDVDPSRKLIVGTGFGQARKFTVDAGLLYQLQPGAITISTYLEYFNGQTGTWMATADPYSTATFELIGGAKPTPLPEGIFYDMQDPNDWRYESIYSVVDAGLITGYDDRHFGVNDSLSTAQLLTILWRYAAPEEAANYDASVTFNRTDLIDVKPQQYYTGAVNWAYENGVVSGYDTAEGKRLDPDAAVPTERAMTIIANYVNGTEPSMSDQEIESLLGRCTDGWTVSKWARSGLAWAIKTGMISGYEAADGSRELRPHENIPRGRFAVILDNGLKAGIL